MLPSVKAQQRVCVRGGRASSSRTNIGLVGKYSASTYGFRYSHISSGWMTLWKGGRWSVTLKGSRKNVRARWLASSGLPEDPDRGERYGCGSESCTAGGRGGPPAPSLREGVRTGPTCKPLTGRLRTARSARPVRPRRPPPPSSSAASRCTDWRPTR